MSPDCTAGFARWIADLEARYLRDLTPTEVARALRALSSTYVERRARLSGRGAFDSAGKRAAYALYYAPRRFLMAGHVVAALAPAGAVRVTDLGSGTGAAGAAWVCRAGPGSSVTGLDPHPWAVEEARATYRAFGIDGVSKRGTAGEGAWLRPGRRRDDNSSPASAVLLSYVVNELSDELRRELLEQVLVAAKAGTHVLVMEPVSRRTSPWWPAWTRAFLAAGGRDDEWRLQIAPPPLATALGKAAGLDPIKATGRTLWLGPAVPR